MGQRTLTADEVVVLRAVRAGATCAKVVAAATSTSWRSVDTVAACLRGARQKPDLLCCHDGMSWAVTYEGALALQCLDHAGSPHSTSRR